MRSNDVTVLRRAGSVDDVKLLPCPFCGGQPIESIESQDCSSYNTMGVHCPSCGFGINGPAYNLIWNKRASSGRPPTVREEQMVVAQREAWIAGVVYGVERMPNHRHVDEYTRKTLLPGNAAGLYPLVGVRETAGRARGDSNG